MIADGQVSLGPTVLKATATKIRVMGAKKNVVAGFAGGTADALAMLSRLDDKLNMYPDQLLRACVELGKDWRTDKYLRRLEAMMIVANLESMFILSGMGDIIEPDNNIAAIGSGGNYALAAATALIQSMPELDIQEIGLRSMKIASDLCVYTNANFKIEVLENKNI
jgi:ATP-dependent HslUV protease subunit HslV